MNTTNIESLKLHDKKLEKIQHIEDFLDKSGLTRADLFNNKGALLVHEGKTPPERIHHISVYTYVDSIKKHQRSAYSANARDIDETHVHLEKIRSKLRQQFGEQTVSLYQGAVNFIADFMDSGVLTDNKVNKARDLIEETYGQDRSALHACVHSLRFADTYTYNHSLSVYLLFAQALEDFKQYNTYNQFYEVFKQMCSNINFNTRNLKKYALGALLHDYGKIMVPEEILNKPGKLTDAEFAIMKQHPRLGMDALASLDSLEEQALDVIGNHHPEYPSNQDSDFSPLSQICNIVDIFDACHSNRVYRQGMSYDDTMQVLETNRTRYKWHPFIYMVITKQTLPNFKELVAE